MPSPTQPNSQRHRSILVRGVNWLGDAVMSTPALLRLREAHPQARITLLTPEKLKGLWTDHPALDEVLTFGPTESGWTLGQRLQNRGFASALVLPNSFRSAFEVWWARIPIRIGYGGQGRSWLLTDPVKTRPGAIRMHKATPQEIGRRIAEVTGAPGAGVGRLVQLPETAHHIHQYLHLAGRMEASVDPVAPCLRVTKGEIDNVLARFKLAQPPDVPLLGLNAGAEYGPAKRWPLERFMVTAQQIQESVSCRWVIFGGKADVELARQVTDGLAGKSSKAGLPAVNLAGGTSLRELCAALAACQLLLTNDTGPMHVAAALGVPVVVPFGSTSPELTGPGLPGTGRHQLLSAAVPCAPCFLRECPIDFRCMRSIEVTDVVAAIRRVIA